MKHWTPTTTLLIALSINLSAPLHTTEPTRTTTLKHLFKKHPNALQKATVDTHNLHFHIHLSIINTQTKKPALQTYTFGSQMNYIYPTNTIKPTTTITTLQQLNQNKKNIHNWINKDTPIQLNQSNTT